MGRKNLLPNANNHRKRMKSLNSDSINESINSDSLNETINSDSLNMNELGMTFDDDCEGYCDDINLFDESSIDLDDIRDLNYSDNNESNITNDILEEAKNEPQNIEIQLEENIIYGNIAFNTFLRGAIKIQGDVKDINNPRCLEPIFEGANWTVEDLLLVLEMFKVTGKLTDGFENCILGLIASILPNDNVLSNCISETTGSNYCFQKIIKNGHHQFPKMRVFEIPVCNSGCTAFIGESIHEI